MPDQTVSTTSTHGIEPGDTIVMNGKEHLEVVAVTPGTLTIRRHPRWWWLLRLWRLRIQVRWHRIKWWLLEKAVR